MGRGPTGLRPFALLMSCGARSAQADLRREWGIAKPTFPLTNLVSKHSPSVRTSPTWGRRKSLNCGMCSGPPRYYNLMNRQAGCSLILPPLRAARLFCCLRAGGSEPSGTGCRGEANFALHAFSETSLPIRKRLGKQHTSRKRTLTLSRFIGCWY